MATAPLPGGEGEPVAEGDDGGSDDSDADDEGDDEDVDAVEPISFSDLNVPTWQELIAALYRPER